MAASSAENVINQHNKGLVTILPLEDEEFLALLKEANLLPLGSGAAVRAKLTRAEKVSYYLEHCIRPGAEHVLPELLKVMENCDSLAVHKLAEDMQATSVSALNTNDHKRQRSDTKSADIMEKKQKVEECDASQDDQSSSNPVCGVSSAGDCGKQQNKATSDSKEDETELTFYKSTKSSLQLVQQSLNTNIGVTRIFCKKFNYLVRTRNIMGAKVVSEFLYDMSLIGPNDFEAIEAAPSDHAKVSILLEYFRHMDVDTLLSVFNDFKKVDSDGKLSEYMLVDLKSLNVSDVPQHQVSSDDQKVSSSFEDLQFKFLNFIDTLCKTLENLVPNVLEILINTCKKMMAYNSSNREIHDNIKLFPDNYLRALCQCNYVITLLGLLAPYLTWYSHSFLSAILEPLMDLCSDNETLQRLNEFLSMIKDKPIQELPIPEPCRTMIPYRDSKYTVLAITLKNNISPVFISMEYINKVVADMADKFGIEKHSFHLLAVDKEKPIVFYWLILKSLVPLIAKSLQDYLEHFKEKKWSEVSIYPNILYVISSNVKVGAFTFLNLDSNVTPHLKDVQEQHHQLEKLEKQIKEYEMKLKEQESCHEAQIAQVYKENQEQNSHLENKVSHLEEEIRALKSDHGKCTSISKTRHISTQTTEATTLSIIHGSKAISKLYVVIIFVVTLLNV